MTGMRRTAAAALAVIAAAAVLAGCQQGAQSDEGATGGSVSAAAAQSGGAGAARGGSDLTHYGNLSLSIDRDPVIERNQARWTLPLQRYSPVPAGQLELLATDLIRTQCLRDSGFPGERTMSDYDAPSRETEGADGERLFTVELAQKYGYRIAPYPGDNYAVDKDNPERDWRLSKSDEYLNAWERCLDQASAAVDGWKTAEAQEQDQQLWQQFHPDQPYPTTDEGRTAWMNEQDTLGQQGLLPSQNDPTNLNMWQIDMTVPRLQDAAAQWRACMAPLGIVDLPQEPWDPGNRPPESLTTRWNWQDAGEKASADEIAVATHDAQCRQDSGWFDVLYDETWNQEEAFIAQHQAELDAKDLAENIEMAEHAVQTIQDFLQRNGSLQ